MNKEQRASVAATIEALRIAGGMTQEELAEAAGITRRTVGNIERGDVVPQLNKLADIMRALGSPLDDSQGAPDIEAFLLHLGVLLRQVPAPMRPLVHAQIAALARVASEVESGESNVTHPKFGKDSGPGGIPYDDEVPGPGLSHAARHVGRKSEGQLEAEAAEKIGTESQDEGDWTPEVDE